MKVKDYVEKPDDFTVVYTHAPKDFIPFASDAETDYYDRREKSSFPFKGLNEKEQEYEITAVVRDSIVPYMVTLYCEIPRYQEVV